MIRRLKYSATLGAFAALLPLLGCEQTAEKQPELERLVQIIDSIKTLPEDSLRAHRRNLIMKGANPLVNGLEIDSANHDETEYKEIVRKQSSSDNPDSILMSVISTELGYNAARRSESDEAIRFYNLSIKFFPQNSRAYEGIVSEYLKKGNINSAKEYAEKAIKNCEGEFINYLMLAEIQLKRGKYRECNIIIKKGLNECRGKRIDPLTMERLKQIKQEATRQKNYR